jgi:hypothetical protein
MEDGYEYIAPLPTLRGNAPPGDSNLHQSFLGMDYPEYQHQQQNRNYCPNRNLSHTTPKTASKPARIAESSFVGQPKHKYEFYLTTNLPFLQLPVGTGENYNNEAILSGLFDSGGCCNMGW